MSDTLQEMLLTRLGYRTESYSGSGVRDLHAVLKHELSVLRNFDVLIYCNERYFAGFGFFYGDDFKKILATSADYYVGQIEQFVRRRLRTTRPLYGLWLTTKDNVHGIYGGMDKDVACYAIPQHAFVLSDLGVDGALFVYQKHPSVYMRVHQHQKQDAGKRCSFLRRWFRVRRK